MKNKLHLPNVTLFAATSVEVEQANFNLKISSDCIEFAEIKLLSSSLPARKYEKIKYVSIPSMKIFDYNRLIIEDLYKYFNTSHCLILQSDSFVLDANHWKKEFLNFDYIGAPWPKKIKVNPNLILDMEKNQVGNGGFSLRSHKLAKITSKINYKEIEFPIKSEDIIICHYLYKKMLDNGINFAPPELASKFSMENVNRLYGQNENSVFGFHGKHLREYFYDAWTKKTLSKVNSQKKE